MNRVGVLAVAGRPLAAVRLGLVPPPPPGACLPSGVDGPGFPPARAVDAALNVLAEVRDRLPTAAAGGRRFQGAGGRLQPTGLGR